MGNQKPLIRKDNKYWLPPNTFYAVLNYARSYVDLKAEANALLGVKGMVYDGMPHGTSVGNPTESIGIRYSELNDKCKEIEDLCDECAGINGKWLLMLVTSKYLSYDKLIARGMVCSRRQFLEARHKFYYKLAKKRDLF